MLATLSKQTKTKSHRKTYLNRRKRRTTESLGNQINIKKTHTQKEQTHCHSFKNR